MKIGFDIDDVLGDFISPLLRFAAPILKKEYSAEDMKFVDHYGEVWNVETPIVFDIVGNFYKSEAFRKMVYNPEAIELITYLKSLGVELCAITARPDFIKELTLVWLQEGYGDTFTESNLYCTNKHFGGKVTKGQLCKPLGVNYFVEDDVDNIIGCVKNNINTFIYDKPWNRDYNDATGKAVRVKNLTEIIEYVK